VPTENLAESDREMIAVVVSALRRCTYCLASHPHALRQRSEIWSRRIGSSLTGATPSCRVAAGDLSLRGETDAVCSHRRPRGPGGLETLGLHQDEVWDVAELTAMYSFTNGLALAMGFESNSEYHYLDRHEPATESNEAPRRLRPGRSRSGLRAAIDQPAGADRPCEPNVMPNASAPPEVGHDQT
jgi:AhpD family alkylhydroperoxidase